MTKNALKKLRDKLPHGYGSLLAKRTDKTESAVYQALTGKINSDVIINEAIALANETKQKNNDIIKNINSI